MKHEDWKSLHISAYKAFMRQKYGGDMDRVWKGA